MAAFVILALALAILALGMVVVAVIVLLRQVQGLTASVTKTSETVRGLLAELDEETAVLSTEAEAIQRRVAGDDR